MMVDDAGIQLVSFELANFHSRHVTRVVCAAIARSQGKQLEDAARLVLPGIVSSEPLPDSNEGWRAFADPVWPVMYVTSVALAAVVSSKFIVAGSVLEIPMFSASIAGLAFVVTSMHASTLTRIPLSVRVAEMRLRRFGTIRARLLGDRSHVSTWFLLNRAPGTVRSAIDSCAILCTLFLMRAMVLEPFKIASESMLPTMVIADFILINKSAYTVRAPLTRTPLFLTWYARTR